MRRIENIEDDYKGIATYELSDGRRVQIDARQLRERGISTILKWMGLAHEIPTERVPVTQCGRKIGTVPGDFDPISIKSQSLFYDPRRSDFKRDGNVWIAGPMLGAGDLSAIPGFVWDRPA